MSRRRHTLAVLALLAGALVKFIPILLLPAAVLLALRDLPEQRRRWRFCLLTLAACLALLWVAYRPFWAGPEILSIQRRAGLFTSSLPAVAYHWLSAFDRGAARWVSPAALASTAAFVCWRSWRARPGRVADGFALAAFDILAFYLLVTCLWFQRWYTSWLVGIAALLAYGWRQRFAAFFSLAAVG